MLKEKAAVITGGVSMSVSGLNTELYTQYTIKKSYTCHSGKEIMVRLYQYLYP